MPNNFSKILKALGQKETYEDTARGVAQGMTGYFGDELVGAMQADKDRIENRLPDEVGPYDVQKQPVLEKFADDYQKYRDIQREDNASAQARTPIGYSVGDIAGGLPIASPLGIKGAAMLGGALSLGRSNADNPEDLASETLAGAGQSAAFSGVMGALGNAVRGKKPPTLPDNVSKLPGAAKKAVSSGEDDLVGNVTNLDWKKRAELQSSKPLKVAEDRTAEVEKYLSERERDKVLEAFLNRYTGKERAAIEKTMNKASASQPYVGKDISNPIFHPEITETNKSAIIPIKNVDISDGIIGKELLDGGPDPFAWLDNKFGLSKKLLQENKDKDLTIITRSDLIAHDDYLGKLTPKKSKVIMLITGDNSQINRVLTPGAPSFDRQLNAAKKLRENGIDVSFQLEKIDGMRPDYNGLSLQTQFELAKARIPWTQRPISVSDPNIRNQLDRKLGEDWAVNDANK